jgi:RNA polymerase sigma-70 factor, ECF subfamily
LRKLRRRSLHQTVRAVSKILFGNKIGSFGVYVSVGTLRERKRLFHQHKLTAFEEGVLPHLDAAYNLARWLTRNDQDAEDVVQEASLRAFRYWKGFSGGDCRSWLLAIVRNTFYTWVRQQSVQPELTEDGEVDDVDNSSPDPETTLLQNCDREMLRLALEDLPVEFREAIVLREMEGLSYKEIADIAGVPVGTVMSRLARGRRRLQIYLTTTAVRNL